MSAAAAIAVLTDAYPRADFPDRTVQLYARMLADQADEDVMEAVKRLICRSTFLPTIAEIREEIARGRLALPTTEEAWDIARAGSLRRAAPEVRAAADAVGGRYAILTSTRPETLRAQFNRDYEARVKRSIEVLTGSAVPAAPPMLLNGTLAELPMTERMRPRAVMTRLMVRWSGREPGIPTEEEKADAIEVLRAGHWSAEPGDDPLYREAEAIFVDASQ